MDVFVADGGFWERRVSSAKFFTARRDGKGLPVGEKSDGRPEKSNADTSAAWSEKRSSQKE